MKTPRFEELARRWHGKAEIYFVFSEEAHPHADNNARLRAFAAKVQSLDVDHDGAVTLAEYGTAGPRFMFDAFDVDHDGVVQSNELLAARRVEQFKDVEEPRTIEERTALARKFRAEVPGAIPVLIDPIDNRTSKAYGELPNSAFVIGPDGRVAMKQVWAATRDVDRELARLTGAPAPAPAAPPDLSSLAPQLASAKARGARVLVDFVSPGCDACKRMDATTLADADVQRALAAGFEVVRLGVEHDAAWKLFEDLDLAATPAFVIVGADGTIGERRQGMQDRAAFLAFLEP